MLLTLTLCQGLGAKRDATGVLAKSAEVVK
jgi:hypothetical protein